MLNKWKANNTGWGCCVYFWVVSFELLFCFKNLFYGGMTAAYNNIVPYRGQVYSRIKANLLQTGSKFQDPDFPPSNQSLFGSSKKNNGIEWKRAQVSISGTR